MILGNKDITEYVDSGRLVIIVLGFRGNKRKYIPIRIN